FWGCLDCGWGLYLSEFCNRRRFGRSLRLLWRPQADHRYLLWRQPGSHRANPAFLLPPLEARYGGQAAMGYRGSLFGRNGGPAGGGRVAVSWRGTCRHPLLRQHFPATPTGGFAGRRTTVTHTGPGSFGFDSEQASVVLSQRGFTHVW